MDWLRRADEQYVVMRKDVEWYNDHDVERRNSIPEARSKVSAFAAGTISIYDFKDWFNSFAQRNGWSWTLGKFAAAEPFNVWVNTIPNTQAFTSQLKAVILSPATVANAMAAMRSFSNYIELEKNSGAITGHQAMVGKVPSVIGGFWHIQEPGKWPLFYGTIRDVFKSKGIYSPVYPPDDYFQLLDLIEQIKNELNLNFYEVEHICRMINDGNLNVP